MKAQLSLYKNHQNLFPSCTPESPVNNYNELGVEGEVVAGEVVARVHFLWENAQFQV